jgi:hypothetical protein
VDQLNSEPVPTSKIKKPVREKKKKLVQCLDCNSDCPKFPLEDFKEHYRSTHRYINFFPGLYAKTRAPILPAHTPTKGRKKDKGPTEVRPKVQKTPEQVSFTSREFTLR